MSGTEETIKQEPTLSDVMKALAEITNRLDSHDLQFEAIRRGLVDNSVSFDRLQGSVLNLRADVKELTEEVRQSRKVPA